MQSSLSPIREVSVTRYVTPLREGGSLPAITEADDGFLYVLKFRGAGQGVKALVAELIGGELARLAGFKVPEIVFARLDEGYGRTEPDEEIQDLLKASIGLNLGLHYLSGSLAFDPVTATVDPTLAARIVWLDAYIMNVDRTPRNTNMLNWNRELWLIDHGASLYFHHNWEQWRDQVKKPFTAIKDHVLLPFAGDMEAAEQYMKEVLQPEKILALLQWIPEEWLLTYQPGATAEEIRKIYAAFLLERLEASAIFTQEANHARKALI